MNKETKKIKIVAVDLDGTLLDQSARVPERNAWAVRRIQAQGVGVILATGKTREAAVPIIEELDLTLPGVFFQGHLISEANGRILREKAMQRELVDEVYAYIQQHDLSVVIYDRIGLWSPTSGLHRDLIHDKYAEPLPRLLRSPQESTGINKILIATQGDRGTLRGDLEARFGARLRVLQAIPEFIELMNPEVSKGEGVAWLLDYLAVDPQAMLAIGDGENDIEMLQLAGTGVAMANAAPHVKAAADYVVGSNEQAGVAEALERFVMRSL